MSWSDPLFRNIVWQVLVIGAVAAIVWYLVGNTNRNLTARHIATGFAFLGRTAAIPIGEHIISYDPAVNTYGYALLIGVLNTLKVAVIGIILATILGTVIGIARLSKNFLVARLAAIYVETLRDIPVLLQLLFWYTLLGNLPGPRQAIHLPAGIFISNRGVKFPLLDWQPAPFLGARGIPGRAARHDRLVRDGTEAAGGDGSPTDRLAGRGGAAHHLPVFIWAVLGGPFTLDMPALHGLTSRAAARITPEYLALTFGLVIYTATYIAEIVRSGIQAVPQGQWEAAGALGLRPRMVLRRIVLPQALRVIVPPMTSQYLNLTKNSSLAVAIGVPGHRLDRRHDAEPDRPVDRGHRHRDGVFLVISLSISFLMNWYNARIALVER